ncbi:kinase-like protein [Gigaspora margarita]|uniref:Kinase-like protein n=1 Tax=Gigaspora margarita TaxID=4874 RepID=A0A8H4AKH8_GIGMA|nr:kinase-like protein [Gigaspora margarita]
MTRTNYIEEIPFKEFTAINMLNMPELGIFKTATLKCSNISQTVALILDRNNTSNAQKTKFNWTPWLSAISLSMCRNPVITIYIVVPNWQLVPPYGIPSVILYLQDIQHKNVIKFYGTTYDLENNKYMVFQFVADGNLRDYLVRNKISRKTKLKIARDIAKGLEYLHKKGIVHENLSPSTIFVENKNAFIANPTVSSVTKKESSVNTMRNMIPYLDPRSFKNPQYRPDFKSNIYSLGVIMWQIFSCKEPLSNYSNLMSFVCDVLSNKREEPIGDAPDEYISLYKDCWSSDPDKRPSIQQVVSRLMHISV